MSVAYYNEIDSHAVQWLRNLIYMGHIAPGDVDERSIEDVTPNDLRGYRQCHFFAGIGIWSAALRAAGWGDDREVWTGSCPCQPFSEAGQGLGFADERHLWPAWFHLIEQRRPVTVFGEQVVAQGGRLWFDLVHADLEAAGYAVGETNLCAAGVGAPNIRQRLFWVADAAGERSKGATERPEQAGGGEFILGRPIAHGLADSRRLDSGTQKETAHIGQSQTDRPADIDRRHCVSLNRPKYPAGAANSYWSNADWLGCVDNKYRPVAPGAFPLVDGYRGRVGALRAYGNAINEKAAQAFIESFLEAEPT